MLFTNFQPSITTYFAEITRDAPADLPKDLHSRIQKEINNRQRTTDHETTNSMDEMSSMERLSRFNVSVSRWLAEARIITGQTMNPTPAVKKMTDPHS